MPILATTGTKVPAQFPIGDYDQVQAHMGANNAASAVYKKFAGGWNALAFRYAEALECADQFEKLVLKHGNGPPQPARYEQERAIFDCCTSSLSTLEACAYACYAMASVKHGTSFPLTLPQDEKKISPASLSKKLDATFPTDPLTTAWKEVINKNDFVALGLMRNILSHRVVSSRHHFVGGDRDGSAVWELTGDVITKDMLKPTTVILTNLLCELLPAVAQFAIARC